MSSQLTSSQQQAVAARGNVLVMAGAGTGKTRTLVERCLDRVLRAEPPVSLDRILMVTFTEAAAAEMRRRIRSRLLQSVETETGRGWLEEQLALLDSTHISTLHGFCLELVRRHFYELDLDPQISVLSQEEADLLQLDTLDSLLQRHYAGQSDFSRAVQDLIQVQGNGWDSPIRSLVRRLHDYTQTRPDPEAWYAEQQTLFEASAPSIWRQWLFEGVQSWQQYWQPILRAEPEENLPAHRCAQALTEAESALGTSPSSDEAGRMARLKETLEAINAADLEWPKGKKTRFRSRLKRFFEEAQFLGSLMPKEERDPLAEDWQWVRPYMQTLLALAREYGEDYARAKRDLAAVDFHDLEQFALRLLWDRQTGRPTEVARHWREKLDLIFVDEYQDINAAQDAILAALSRHETETNRFLVGDVKQSIYRFRLADPHIFQRYAESWEPQDGPGRVVPLSDNFRSHESILDFVNGFFAELMQAEVGGVSYPPQAELKFGAPENRPQFRKAVQQGNETEPPLVGRVELHLRLQGQGTGQSPEEADESSDEEEDSTDEEWLALSAAEKEARMVAWRLLEMKKIPHMIWDERQGGHRAVEWRDMVVLLRSPVNKAESFAKEFHRLGIPLLAPRGGFYETTEVTDLLSLLRLLDNPLQDVPVLAVLRSPLVGLSPDELARIRLADRKAPFWIALQRWLQTARENSFPDVPEDPPAGPASELFPRGMVEKVDRFLTRYARWRTLSRRAALSHCVETVLDETQYETWLRTQPRGDQRVANVQRLLELTREFDRLQRQGVYRFLRFIEAQQSAELDQEPASAETGNAVRLMSIHQSKGTEFPVVVLADLSKAFRHDASQILLDEEYGLCPQIKPPDAEQRYPSLVYWLARRRQRREMLGEEIRLLYVALTRACDTLLLAGTLSSNRAEQWEQTVSGPVSVQRILEGSSYLDWLGAWLPRNIGAGQWTQPGEGGEGPWRWVLYGDPDPRLETAAVESSSQPLPPHQQGSAEPDFWHRLKQRLAWDYPFGSATVEPAKSSVSLLRRRREEWEEESQRASFLNVPPIQIASAETNRLNPAEIGIAHHLFLQYVALDRTGDANALEGEAQRLCREQLLTEAESAALDFRALAGFWKSDLGRWIVARSDQVHRELPFTVRFTAEELSDLQLNPADQGERLTGEYVVVQGVIDLAVITPDEMTVVDFKTDDLKPSQLEEKIGLYRPQLLLYGRAIADIYQRPVTGLWLHFLSLNRSVAVGQATN